MIKIQGEYVSNKPEKNDQDKFFVITYKKINEKVANRLDIMTITYRNE